jgi:hypothetical protein
MNDLKSKFSIFVGLDWANKKHDVCVQIGVVQTFANGTKCAFDILYQVKACAALTAFPRGIRMAGFSQNPFCAPY